MRGALDSLLPESAPSAADSTADDEPVDDTSLRIEEPIELLKGTFTWSVLATPEREEAEVLLEYLAEDDYRTALYIEQRAIGPMYHVVVGQFATQVEAEAVRPILATVPATETYRLIPLEITNELEQPW